MSPPAGDLAWLGRLGGGGRVRLEREGGLARLVLDRAERRNALTPAMMVQLHEAVERLAGWDGVAVVLHGAGGFFCSGGDLGAVQARLASPEEGARMCAFMQGVTARLRRLPVLSVAAVEGGAVGGGAELVTACDLRVLAEGARVRFVQSALGVSTGWGGGARLVRILGRARALRVLALGEELVGGPEALAVGFADRTCPPGGALDAARELLAPALARPPAAVRAVKRAVAAEDLAGLDAAMLEEAEAFAGVWGGPAHRAALAARRRR